MRDRKVDVAVAGGGIAGAAAAEVLGRYGVRVLVLDDNPHLGGQYLRGGDKAASPGWPDRVRRRGLRLIAGLPPAKVEVLKCAEVIGVEPGFTLLVSEGNERLSTVTCKRLLIATGARERFLPFPGWTLPGVLSTGAVQILIKQSGVLPAKDAVAAGAGLFLAAVARDIQKNGGRVPALIDEACFGRRIPRFGLLLRQPLKFIRGAGMLGLLRLAGTKVLQGMRIVEARGRGGLEQVVAARVAASGEVIPESTRSFRAQCLAVGFGFTANIEVAQLAGCETVFLPEGGGWVVKVDDRLETSVEGISAAGEVCGVGGAPKSLVEGRLAGVAILERMGRLGRTDALREISALQRSRTRLAEFGRYFNSQYSFEPDYMAAWVRRLPDDVPVCRCEGTRLGDIRRAVAEGLTAPAAVKKATRCGMGICQGSTCKTILAELLAALTGRPPALIPPPSVRIPLRPVALGVLAGGGS